MRRTGLALSIPHETFSYAVYDALRQQPGGLSRVIAYVPLSVNKVSVRIGAQPEEAEGDMVSGVFFSGLGVNLPWGRGFTDDDERNHAAIAVLSYNYWTRRFARDPHILGQTLFVNGVATTIVGVAAEGFEGLEAGGSTDFWIPLQSRPRTECVGQSSRRRESVHRQSEVVVPAADRTRGARRDENPGGGTTAAGFSDVRHTWGSVRALQGEKAPVLSFTEATNFPGYDEQYGKPLRILMAMVGLVLLIAVANVVMLLMARNANRQREFALRQALGAGRGELFRQLVTEAALLVAAGGALAWGFAMVATRLLGRLGPDRVESCARQNRAAFHAGRIGRRGASLWPGATARGARQRSRTGPEDLCGNLAHRYRQVAHRQNHRGLADGALHRAAGRRGPADSDPAKFENTPLGMQVDGLVVFGVKPHPPSIPEGVAFYQELMRNLRPLPGVESVTVMEERIGSWWSNNGDMMVDGKLPDVPNGGSRWVRSNVVGPDFFTTLGVPVLAGRDFADSDDAGSPHVGIINEEFAKRFLPNQNPLGHIIGTSDGRYSMTIVGVVKDHKYRSIAEDPIPDGVVHVRTDSGDRAHARRDARPRRSAGCPPGGTKGRAANGPESAADSSP